MDTLLFRPPPSTLFTIDARTHHHHHQPCASTRPPGQTATSSYLSVPRPRWRLWPRREEEDMTCTLAEDVVEGEGDAKGTWRGNWVMKILRVRSIWEGDRGSREEEREAVNELLDEGDRCVGCCEGDDVCCVVEEDRRDVEIDRDVFSNLLKRVTLTEAEFYERMSYLGSLAYAIPKIKPSHLLKVHGLHFITSSLEEKMRLSNAETEKQAGSEKVEKGEIEESKLTAFDERVPLGSSGVYGIVASAASYVQSQTNNVLPPREGEGEDGRGTDSPEYGDGSARRGSIAHSEEASFVVTSESVTAVVAAKKEVKDAVAKDLNSSRSSPCEWYICDDDRSGTRFFIIQGSETLQSWQANLLFEPVQFEGLDVLVHRGIYEAAKGIYQQMLPEIRAHLAAHGSSATLRFTGHSLGGSLSLLINLMLLIRGEAPASALLPVITFGAPSILCGGNSLLEKLGLPRNHLQAITLHRDIVPRAFSCTYPDRVADILKAVNGNFRNHPCLKHQKLLYSPMGEILILQPEESFSPHHHLLPSGSGLYFFGHSLSDANNSRRLLRTAFSVFLNNPHPLEILSDRGAYGAEGTIMRDHDMSSYLRSVRAVIRRERRRIRKAQREIRRRDTWPLLDANGSSNPRKIDIASALKGGKESLERFSRMAGSQNARMFIMFLFPIRMFVLQALAVATSI